MMNLHSSFLYRKMVDRGMAVVCALLFLVAFIPLLSVLWLVITKGCRPVLGFLHPAPQAGG